MIVNSAASNLRLSANPCARALSNAAGSSLQAQCDKAVAKGPLSEWNFAITSAGKLGCKSVYHAVCGGYDGTGQAEKVMFSSYVLLQFENYYIFF